MISAANGFKPPVLTCWKDIANYMGKGVRTVQRWEQEFGLPVRRPLGSNKKAVLARPSDLDAWVALRCGARKIPDGLHNGKHQDSVIRLAALSAQIQTAQQLREDSRMLVHAVHSQLAELHERIAMMNTQSESRSGRLAG